MLIVDSLFKIYDSDILKNKHNALNNLKFSIKEGTITGFLGPNGSGKTTTIKIILDFIKSTEGKVIYGETLGGNLAEALKLIGYTPERPYFYPHITGKDFITYLGRLSLMTKQDIAQQIQYWAPRLKIDHALDKRLNNYSKGMLQRIGFISAVLHRPKLLILDEPASGLDPLGRKELKDAIKEVHKLGTTVFFSTHIVSDVEEICSNLILIESGACAYDGKIKDLILKKSLKAYTVKYLQNDKIEEIHLEDQLLQSTLKDLLDKKIIIYSVEPQRLTLEEIIYDSSKGNREKN